MSTEITMNPEELKAVGQAICRLGEEIGKLPDGEEPTSMTENDWGNYRDSGREYLAARESNNLTVGSLEQEAIINIGEPIYQSGVYFANQDDALADLLSQENDVSTRDAGSSHSQLPN